MEHALDLNDETIHLAGKTEYPDKYIPKQDLWLHKLTNSDSKI